jgi:hypothetical protein
LFVFLRHRVTDKMSSGPADGEQEKAAAPSTMVESQVTAAPAEAAPAGENKSTGKEEGTDTAVSPPTTAAAAPPSPACSEARMQNALSALLRVLDSDIDDDATATPPLHTVQKMCMRIPQLSNEMTRPQRFRLYTLLLLEHDDVTSKSALPESWTAYAEKALETHVAVAQQAVELFPASLNVTVDELAGLFYHLGAETAFYFNPEMIDVILCVTYVVAGGRSTNKAVLLRALYQLLYVLQKDFLVSTASRLYEPATTALLRLMLQFFDPGLATHMDQQQVEVGTYVLEWSRRMLVLHSDFETALKVLDWVFILGDPVMIPYVAEAYLITHRQHLLSMQSKQDLTSCLTGMKLALPGTGSAAVDPKLVDGRATALMPVWSGKSLLQNADLLYRMTPLSTQRMLDFCLFPDVGTLNKTPEDLRQYYDNTPCLPLERSDLASAFAKRLSHSNDADAAEEEGKLPSREYIIVDCRSQASYDYVRLPTAILVGDILSYQQEELEVVMSRLESCRGRPMALFGTGRPIVEEVNLLKVLALFLINKKSFPFVCIVPGGFKTTIPLLRNRVIDAVMSPAAAASLGPVTKSASTDWGQQASNTAHQISATLSEISSLLPHVETVEVRQKAEELGSKAKAGVAAAGSWGWGMMQRLREGLNETREHASTALSSVATKLSATQTNGAATATTAKTQAGTAGNVAQSSTAAAATTTTTTQATTAPLSSQHPPISQQQQQIFSLGEDGEEDDLDLITFIPTRPMRGTVVDAPRPEAAAATATIPTAVAANAKAAETVSTPERRPTASSQPAETEVATNASAAAAASSPSNDAPVESSPLPVPPSPQTDKLATMATASALCVARGASASQIAANIDAEFDELFGDINTTPLATTRLSASPTKSSAAANEDDLFGV